MYYDYKVSYFIYLWSDFIREEKGVRRLILG